MEPGPGDFSFLDVIDLEPTESQANGTLTYTISNSSSSSRVFDEVGYDFYRDRSSRDRLNVTEYGVLESNQALFVQDLFKYKYSLIRELEMDEPSPEQALRDLALVAPNIFNYDILNSGDDSDFSRVTQGFVVETKPLSKD